MNLMPMCGQQFESAESILADYRPTLTLKQARRILGKDISDSIDDAHLSRILGELSNLAKAMIDDFSVPKNEEVEYNGK